MTWKTAALAIAGALTSISLSAQIAEQPPRGDIELEAATPAPPSPSGSTISLDRIQKKLAERPRSAQDGLKLEYYIEVYGKAPTVDFFENFDVTAGPVPWAGPTHQDILDVVTPEGFRTPAPNLSALIEWLRQKAEK